MATYVELRLRAVRLERDSRLALGLLAQAFPITFPVS